MSTALTVSHQHGHSIALGVGRVEILRYVYGEQMPQFEAPKPFLHPIRTLSGALVSAYRPWDHRWHKGLQMTWSHVSGQNFWGGNTYVHGTGYVPLENVGGMRHDGFGVIEHDGSGLTLQERLTWVTQGGEEWVSETRGLRVHDIDTQRGSYAIDVHSELTNVRGENLELGSPTTHGRENAGYTGWFWRGPRGLTGGRVLAADGAGPEAMGTPSAWLAYTGPNDEVDGEVTILAVAGKTSHGSLEWFVRNEPFPAIAPSPAFHDEIVLTPGETLTLSHTFVMADGAWTRDDVESYLSR
ncbi:PmoA family protein [Kineosporia sp. J2-2]|uniref:PmoA family protein n=1 Tax=Kineosporia corallincola TaxID=2835133 RepID=A0ABS5TKN9_9ACTN|nr:PmoA family protein [Kineosporia corallincola]MBT0771661.1 PmoA family protein [Kineosporia corallincola]